MKRLVFWRPINTRDCPLFSSTNFLCAPLSPALVWCAFFCRFLADRDYYGPQEDRPSQTTPLRLHITGDTSPSGRSEQKLFSQEAEQLYHELLCNRSFVSERGFPTSNAFFNSLSRPEDGRHYMPPPPPPPPRPPEWPRSYESSIPTCVFGLAPLCLSGVGGSSSGPGPSTRYISYGMTTVRSTMLYL